MRKPTTTKAKGKKSRPKTKLGIPDLEHSKAAVLRMAAVRRLAYEAADCGLLSPELAAGIHRVKGVRKLGSRLGNWLTAGEAATLWQVPDMFGVGSEWVHLNQNGKMTNSIAGELAGDFMIWPTGKHHFGWFLEPAYDYNFASGHQQSIAMSGGLLIGIPYSRTAERRAF